MDSTLGNTNSVLVENKIQYYIAIRAPLACPTKIPYTSRVFLCVLHDPSTVTQQRQMQRTDYGAPHYAVFPKLLSLSFHYIQIFYLTLRLLMSYIYGAPILDVSRSHTTTQHSR